MNTAATTPAPRRDTSPRAQYLALLARGELAYQVDARGRALFYPRVHAPAGFDDPLHWRASAGLGTVYATTWIAPRGEPAYNLALIDMDEGFRLMSRVEGLEPAAVRIGQRVRVRVQPGAGDDDALPVFEPIGDTADGNTA